MPELPGVIGNDSLTLVKEPVTSGHPDILSVLPPAVVIVLEALIPVF